MCYNGIWGKHLEMNLFSKKLNTTEKEKSRPQQGAIRNCSLLLSSAEGDKLLSSPGICIRFL